MNESHYKAVVSDLRGRLVRFKPGNPVYDAIVAPRDEVYSRFGPIFSPGHVPTLSEEEFTSFLYFENNHHWTGLYRQGLGAASDIGLLREALGLLLNEDLPIKERLPEALGMVTGLGKGIATAVLLVAYPDRYGVWNNTSEAGLLSVDLWPEFEWGDGVGGRYEKINGVLKSLSADLELDLWTLDACWWYLLEQDELPPEVVRVVEPIAGARFGLESQLEAFLLENWDSTPLAKEWAIYRTPEDPEAGNQFPTEVGRIDILAKHLEDERFLVIELKRNQSTDQTVAQTLRYLGWVREHLADDSNAVEALIIAHEPDKKAMYAISCVPGVRMMTYELEFHLNDVQSIR